MLSGLINDAGITKVSIFSLIFQMFQWSTSNTNAIFRNELVNFMPLKYQIKSHADIVLGTYLDRLVYIELSKAWNDNAISVRWASQLSDLDYRTGMTLTDSTRDYVRGPDAVGVSYEHTSFAAENQLFIVSTPRDDAGLIQTGTGTSVLRQEFFIHSLYAFDGSPCTGDKMASTG